MYLTVNGSNRVNIYVFLYIEQDLLCTSLDNVFLLLFIAIWIRVEEPVPLIADLTIVRHFRMEDNSAFDYESGLLIHLGLLEHPFELLHFL